MSLTKYEALQAKGEYSLDDFASLPEMDTDPYLERNGSGVRLYFSDSDTDLSFREKPDPVCMVWCI